MKVTPDDIQGSPQIQRNGHWDGHSVDQTSESATLGQTGVSERADDIESWLL